ncbi:DUF4190 domain-containing protein [Arthrobacter sp. A2-55]|uniref:DUF4190 domain-containing protein n=1 Tax=Arthrobacter sp. A2-55 TaxID=2897337 RepID=UPI0021CD2BB8|nr:hypothetical protein [Arthrobacter sp. A2-55]MCU6480385.1 hypothetical protein [Arthrobacter sp. A2-55]
MSNQPDQPQQYPGTPPGYTPPGYTAPPGPPQSDVPYTPPSDNPYGQPPYGQNPYGQPQYGQNPYGGPAGQFQQPQFAPPTFYQGGPGYIDATSGPRGLSLSSMIIGLVSLFIAGWLIVPQIVGIVLGHIGMKKESPQGKPFSITGLITNYLALVIYVGIYAFLVFLASSLSYDPNASSSEWSSVVSGL